MDEPGAPILDKVRQKSSKLPAKTQRNARSRFSNLYLICSVTVKVAPRAPLISLYLWERAGVRETIMVLTIYIFHGGVGAMIVGQIDTRSFFLPLTEQAGLEPRVQGQRLAQPQNGRSRPSGIAAQGCNRVQRIVFVVSQ